MMRHRTLSTAICALVLVLAAPAIVSAQTDKPPAKPAPKVERACFRPQDILGFSPVDKETVDVSVNVRDVYRLTLFAPAPDLDWTQRIGVQAHSGPWICAGADATIIVTGPLGVERYPVTAIHKLSAEEIKASKKH